VQIRYCPRNCKVGFDFGITTGERWEGSKKVQTESQDTLPCATKDQRASGGSGGGIPFYGIYLINTSRPQLI